MMIYVQYEGGSYDYIKPAMLDGKLISGEVKRFLRSSGWAVVGEDPIRHPDSHHYNYFGPERRQKGMRSN